MADATPAAAAAIPAPQGAVTAPAAPNGASAKPAAPAPNGKPAAAAAAANGAPAEPAAPAKPAAEAPPPPDEMVKRWEQLKAADRARLQREQATKAEAAKLEQRAADLQKQADDFKAMQDSFAKDPFETMKGRGVDPEVALRTFLNGGKKPVDAEVTDVRAELAALRKQLQERDEREQRERADAQRASFRTQVHQAIEGGGERWEIIKALGAHDQVLHLIDGVEKAGLPNLDIAAGTRLPFDKAADMVEDYLAGQSKRLAGVKKFRSFLETSATPAAAPAETPAPSQPSSSPDPSAAPQAPQRAASTLVNRKVEPSSHRRKPAKEAEPIDAEEARDRKWEELKKRMRAQ